MAENLLNTSNKSGKAYYPGASTNWIYLDTLKQYNNELATNAENLISNTKKKVFSSGNRIRLNTLKALLDHERSKERSFFDHFGIPYNEKKSADYIRAMHKFLQIENVLEFNLDRIDRKRSKIDVTKDFPVIFEQTLSTIIESNPSTVDGKVLWDATLEAIQTMYTTQGKGEKENPYKELYEFLRKENNADPMIRTILHYFLGVPVESLQEGFDFKIDAQQIRERMKMDNQNVYAALNRSLGSPTGLLLEQQTQAIVNRVLGNKKGAKVMHTGQLDNMKADTLITFDITLEDDWAELEGKNKSVRARNIQRLKQLHSKMEGSKKQFILQISDKNYSINADFKNKYGGFTAESNISLNDLENVFSRMSVKLESGSMQQLLFALAHIGENTLTKENGVHEAERYLATKIAYFMFDDIGIDEVENSLGANFVDGAIHVFNLNGIYIPLSVYLEALYSALKQSESAEFRDYARVNFEEDNRVDYENKERNQLTRESWEAVQETRNAVQYRYGRLKSRLSKTEQ